MSKEFRQKKEWKVRGRKVKVENEKEKHELKGAAKVDS